MPDLSNMDSAIQLHESVEVIYVVDGYQATFFTGDGDVEVCEAHGRTVLGAMNNLDAKLLGWSRDEFYKRRRHDRP